MSNTNRSNRGFAQDGLTTQHLNEGLTIGHLQKGLTTAHLGQGLADTAAANQQAKSSQTVATTTTDAPTAQKK